MKILVLDLYPEVTYRISKDQNGSYGTANNYGDSILSKIFNKIIKNAIDFPSLYAVQVIGELINKGYSVEYSRYFDEKKNFDLIIVPSSIVCHVTEINKIKELKQKEYNIIAIGPFATNMPDEYIRAGAKVIIGEPEMFFNRNDISKEKFELLPDKIFNFENVNLDDLSRPGWDVIFKYFIPKMKFLGNEPAINIQASRGCPYSCFHYCVYPLQQGRKLRLRSVDKIVDEMNFFHKNLGVKNFIFRDPVFSINKQHTISLCEKLIQTENKFNIAIETHLKNVDLELLKLFAKSGIKLIYVGIETSDDKIKKVSHRTSEENESQIEKVKLIERYGIMVKAMYIIGMPQDNIQTFKKTLNFAKKINSCFAQFSVFTPYPGTPVFKEYEQKITKKNFESFTQWKLVFEHENLSENDILYLLNLSLKSYYFRFAWLIKFFKFKLFRYII